MEGTVKTRHLFIINPTAGKGKTLEFIPEIKELFKELQEDYRIEITNYAGHATEIVRNYVDKGEYRIYSVGGDGTLNEVLNGMMGSNSTLAVIPGGSGNDFFRSINSNHQLQNLLYKTVKGEGKWMDVGKVNEQYFLNISSVGFDAETAFHTRIVKKIPFIKGSTAYYIGILLTIFKNKKYQVEISCNGRKEFSGEVLLTAIANGRFYGGGIQPAPDAKLDDGKLDMCIVKGLGRFRILSLLPLYQKGKHTNMKEVIISQGDKIEIYCNNEIPLNIDGEVSLVKEALFGIFPESIKIVVPNEH